MKTAKPKILRKVTPKSAVNKPGSKTKSKLSKSDPDFYKKIGEISAKRRGLDSNYFSTMAKRSHGPASKRTGYYGGRKPKGDTPPCPPRG